MQRSCAAVLACKQLKGSHIFSALAGALNDIHTEFSIREKIVRTTTDNGSNFMKAFRVYGQTDKSNNPKPVGEGDGEEDDGGQNDEEEESAEGVEFVDAGALLDEDDYLEYQLPKHHRCARHLLNLVSTVKQRSTHCTSVCQGPHLPNALACGTKVQNQPPHLK